MQDAAPAMRGFLSERKARAFAIEFGSPFDELKDSLRPFFDQDMDRTRITQAVSGVDRVLLVKGDLVVVAEGDRNPSLRVMRRGLLQRVLRNHQDASGLCQFDGGSHAGYSGSHHQKIGFDDFSVGLRNSLWYKIHMPMYVVDTPQRRYPVIVERGTLARVADHVPDSAGKLFVVTTEDVWELHGRTLKGALRDRKHAVLFFGGGEERKRLSEVERLAEQMMEHGGDRSSLVLAFGGGIVNDVGGFLASSFMRGVPVIQAPTTLLAQVDAAVGGKTGVNLVAGKNLVGAFHQPLAVVIDPDVLSTLPDREYRAGLYEVLKTGVIRNESLFLLMEKHIDKVLARDPETVLEMVSLSVEVKTAVVTADEKESDLRRILNFGHTVGHALEAETGYSRLLHGEAVAFGMRAATHLARLNGDLDGDVASRIVDAIRRYGPIPDLSGVQAETLVARLGKDKKTIQGTVHFVLPVRIGEVKITSAVDDKAVLEATRTALSEPAGP